MKAFSQIQPLHAYYNTYAAVIFDKSNNTVYGIPYSDRFAQGTNNPAVFTVKYTDPTTKVTSDVATWVIGIGDPIPRKAITGMMELLLLDD